MSSRDWDNSHESCSDLGQSIVSQWRSAVGVWVQDILASAERALLGGGGLILSGRTGLEAVESCRALTEEPSGHVGGVDWDSPVSHLASAALTVWHPQWLLCTFRAWIAGVGGSLRKC